VCFQQQTCALARRERLVNQHRLQGGPAVGTESRSEVACCQADVGRVVAVEQSDQLALELVDAGVGERRAEEPRQLDGAHELIDHFPATLAERCCGLAPRLGERTRVLLVAVAAVGARQRRRVIVEQPARTRGDIARLVPRRDLFEARHVLARQGPDRRAKLAVLRRLGAHHPPQLGSPLGTDLIPIGGEAVEKSGARRRWKRWQLVDHDLEPRRVGAGEDAGADRLVEADDLGARRLGSPRPVAECRLGDRRGGVVELRQEGEQQRPGDCRMALPQPVEDSQPSLRAHAGLRVPGAEEVDQRGRGAVRVAAAGIDLGPAGKQVDHSAQSIPECELPPKRALRSFESVNNLASSGSSPASAARTAARNSSGAASASSRITSSSEAHSRPDSSRFAASRIRRTIHADHSRAVSRAPAIVSSP
jgi:hypothetical protein